ncbi:MAG: hypothetical protein JSW26_16155 [Desulfobacterales bacterium]|nr:MAG: hypothetical protein JSW26_16155 [Desulfobacterales bacterium]
MRRVVTIIFLGAVLCTSFVGALAAELPEDAILRSWVQAMKEAPRGPFTRLRWFCNDGTILPPKEYACREHGGGVQHGEWTDQVKLMRDNGYYIANVYADINPEMFQADPAHPGIVKQMILERFLIDADDGWIFRRARYYRGALQTEDETRGGRGLLIALAKDPEWNERRFVVLREAVRFVPHGRKEAPITEMRQLSLSLAEKDPNFETLRIKIHVHPELSDAVDVRTYAKSRGVAGLAQDYERLAKVIEEIYQPQDVEPAVVSLSKQIKNTKLKRQLNKAAGQLRDPKDPAARFAVAGKLLATLRDSLPTAGQAGRQLALLDTGLVLEGELYRSANELLETLSGAARRQRLMWLAAACDGLYGSGLISARQHRSLQETFQALLETNPQLIDYQYGLEYAARVPEWADRLLRFHFSETLARLEVIEPLSLRYIHDRLRGSLLLFYSDTLESLMADAGRQLDIQNDVFEQKTATGLRGLNAGLARGILRLPKTGADGHSLDRNGIYVLPATTEDLPPVAGIITAGRGNILSHVQLLARNLGIPNVTLDKKLLPQITAREGQKVVLAVSAMGIVQLVEDGPEWDPIFAEESKVQDVVIRPDLNKLDLYNLSFIPLQQMRTTDSGRIAGPKAANLGELKHHFPEAVTDGLVIPFGHFRALLDQQLEPDEPSVFSWMQQQYALIQDLKDDPVKQEQVVRLFLQRMRDWVENADPGEDFRRRLLEAMEETFGPDGSYGVFVRSDTNVEDLPGFTGAGLNLTVANVVGTENVLEAIRRVWASPFTERAYSWRQAYMQNPEHVYASVLLLKSIPADKSGVMVTADVDTGQTGWLTIAVNEGVGGAVSGQTSEELRINLANGNVRLMAHATEPYKRVILKEGGMAKVAASGTEAVLSPKDIQQLMAFARSVAERFPMLQSADGSIVPADIEFGFFQDKLVLFQIRPFLESMRARQNLFLNRLDQRLKEKYAVVIDLDEIPAEETQ